MARTGGHERDSSGALLTATPGPDDKWQGGFLRSPSGALVIAGGGGGGGGTVVVAGDAGDAVRGYAGVFATVTRELVNGRIAPLDVGTALIVRATIPASGTLADLALVLGDDELDRATFNAAMYSTAGARLWASGGFASADALGGAWTVLHPNLAVTAGTDVDFAVAGSTSSWSVFGLNGWDLAFDLPAGFPAPGAGAKVASLVTGGYPLAASRAAGAPSGLLPLFVGRIT